MLNVTVKLRQAIVNEVEFDRLPITIGRGPENDLRIENLAVSSRHARVEQDRDGCCIVDLESTNGTYVNDERVARRALRDTDAVTVGKHTLHFRLGNGKGPARHVAGTAKKTSEAADLLQTMMLDTRSQREREAREAADARRRGGKIGVLTVTQGAADRQVHELTHEFTMLGKDPAAGVRLKGLLVPKVTAFVGLGRAGYTLIPPEAGGALRLNGTVIGERTALKDGDLIEARGVSIRFSLRA